MGKKLHNKNRTERRLRRLKRRAERLKDELEQRLERERAFTETVARPQNPGERCWKCGEVVFYQETKRAPGPVQTFGYRGYLVCPGCKRTYHCDKYKYQIAPLEPRSLPPPSLPRACDDAIAKDRTSEPVVPRLIKATAPRGE